MSFADWLKEEKGISSKASHDVECRLRRAKRIIGSEEISNEDINRIEEFEAFKDLTITVKSQLRRAIRLYSEYEQLQKNSSSQSNPI